MTYKRLTTILFFIFFSTFSHANERCPFPAGAVETEINIETKKIEGNKYHYRYSLKNISTSKLSIFWFFVEAEEALLVKTPSNWKVLKLPTPSHKGFIQWAANTAKDGIAIGETLNGFEIESSLPPGPMIAKVRGLSTDKKFTNFERKEDTFCPGFWDLGSSSEGDSMARYLSLGPISSEVVLPVTYINFQDKNWRKNTEKISISPLDKGDINIIIAGSENFNINDLEVTSITAGRNAVLPKKVEKIKNLPAKLINQLDKTHSSAEHLLITFDVQSLNILCDVDRALVLKGKLSNGKMVRSGFHLNYTPCTPENWVKEVPKIKFRQGL